MSPGLHHPTLANGLDADVLLMQAILRLSHSTVCPCTTMSSFTPKQVAEGAAAWLVPRDVKFHRERGITFAGKTRNSDALFAALTPILLQSLLAEAVCVQLDLRFDADRLKRSLDETGKLLDALPLDQINDETGDVLEFCMHETFCRSASSHQHRIRRQELSPLGGNMAETVLLRTTARERALTVVGVLGVLVFLQRIPNVDECATMIVNMARFLQTRDGVVAATAVFTVYVLDQSRNLTWRQKIANLRYALNSLLRYWPTALAGILSLFGYWQRAALRDAAETLAAQTEWIRAGPAAFDAPDSAGWSLTQYVFPAMWRNTLAAGAAAAQSIHWLFSLLGQTSEFVLAVSFVLPVFVPNALYQQFSTGRQRHSNDDENRDDLQLTLNSQLAELGRLPLSAERTAAIRNNVEQSLAVLQSGTSSRRVRFGFAIPGMSVQAAYDSGNAPVRTAVDQSSAQDGQSRFMASSDVAQLVFQQLQNAPVLSEESILEQRRQRREAAQLLIEQIVSEDDSSSETSVEADPNS